MKFKRYLIFLVWSVGAIISLIFIGNLFIYIFARPYISKNIEDVPGAQVALIPGAAVRGNGQLSPVFEERVDGAALLYKMKKVSKILVSGDNSTDSYNEVNPVRNYLLGKGIPEVDIFLDHAGFDTYSTMYRARDIFQVSSTTISTQSFHLPRSIFLARALGIDAYGIPVDEEGARFKNYVREIFANQKAILNLVFNRQPKFLGETVPITGPGQNYPNPVPEVVPADENEESTEHGFVVGHVIIGPFCPVEREDQPCEIPPEAYSSREVIIYESNGVTIKERGAIDEEGNYRITLVPGNYFVQIEPAGIGPGEKKPVTIKSFETTVVNFDIDTGIR